MPNDNPTDRCPINPRPRDEDRYAVTFTDDGVAIIYDKEDENAWVVSSFSIELESME